MPTKPTKTTIANPALANLFAPEALAFQPQSVAIGASWARVYTLQAFPSSVDIGWLTRLANLPGVTLSLHAAPEDPLEIVQTLNRRIGQLGGQLATHKGGPLVAQRLERQMTDAETLIRQIDAEQQHVFRTLVVLTVHAPDAATGLQACRRLEAACAGQGLRARPLLYRQEDGVKAAGPWGWWPKALQGDTPHTWPVASLAAAWPFGGGTINHGRGIILGKDESGELVVLDRWDPPREYGIPNKNFNVLAVSGGGKTFSTMAMLLREWAFGAQIMILDPVKREYRGLCRELGGQWLNAAGGQTRINPFQPPAQGVVFHDATQTDDATAGGVLFSHIPYVLSFLETLMPGRSPKAQALLAGAVRTVYAEKGITDATDPKTVPNDAWPDIRDLHTYCVAQAAAQSDPEWSDLAGLLQEPAIGTYAQLWGGPSTIDPELHSQFVVADLMQLKTMPRQIRRAQYLNVLGYFWAQVLRDKRQRKIIVADEAWMLIDSQSPETLRFLSEVARTTRALNGSLMTLTQNVFDFMAPAVRTEGEAVLTNAAYTLLLHQDERNLEQLRVLFRLSDAEQDRLLSARDGQGLLIAGNQRAWIHVDASPTEALTIQRSLGQAVED